MILESETGARTGRGQQITERERYRGNEQESGITQVWILKTGFINLFIFFVCFLCHVMIVSMHEDFHF